MSTTPSDDRPRTPDFSALPDPVRLEDTVATQEADEAPDPTSGRDPDTEWLVRYGAG